MDRLPLIRLDVGWIQADMSAYLCRSIEDNGGYDLVRLRNRGRPNPSTSMKRGLIYLQGSSIDTAFSLH